MSDLKTPVNRARELRKKMTKAESLLWQKLRNRKFLNLKFLRQHPIIYQVIDNEPRYFIADFYCAEKMIVVEVDGEIHEFQKEKDIHREDILSSLNMKIVRIKNEEVSEDIQKVLERIKLFALKNNNEK
ncbi:MAG: endonuclease domain-containing protein [Prolixibacteraceae bacterium]|jgi:leucyl-tRNA synthetase